MKDKTCKFWRFSAHRETPTYGFGTREAAQMHLLELNQKRQNVTPHLIEANEYEPFDAEDKIRIEKICFQLPESSY
jgi:hypothetical protein